MLRAYIDGGCEPKNPGGTASWGFVVYRFHPGEYLTTGTDTEEVTGGYGIVGSGPAMSNNVGEYSALLKLLEWFDRQAPEPLEVLSDSQLLVNQMKGEWKVNRDKLFYPYYKKVIAILVQNAEHWKDLVTYTWIPREVNIADTLTVKALEAVGIHRR